MQRIRVGVLMGGKSAEREVSFNSGRTVCDHLDTACYDIIPLFQTTTGSLFILPWSFLHRGKITDFLHRLHNEAESIKWDALKDRVDFIYIAQHGRYAEDGTVQGMLEILGIPYHGSNVYASALGMDKRMHKKVLKAAGISVPRGIVVQPHDDHDSAVIAERLKQENVIFPCVIKPCKEGSSLGTTVVNTADQLKEAVNNAIHVNEKPQPALIEEKINGMEFACIIITDHKTGKLMPLPPTEIVTPEDVPFFDYEQKYMPGRSVQWTPARTSAKNIEHIQTICLQTMCTLGMANMARIDGFLTPDGQVVIIDPNSFSGAAPSSFLFKQAAQINLNHTQLINHIIETELAVYGYKKQVTAMNKKQTKNNKKIRVGVLLGGASNEKEISLDSGRNVIYKLSPHTYQAIPLFVSSSLEVYKIDTQLLVSSSTQEIEKQLTPAMKIDWHDLPQHIDFAFIGLHGGYGENGSIQGALEVLGLPYNGSSVLASALCMDKSKTNELLKSQGFDVPTGKLITQNEWQTNQKAVLDQLKQIPLPCIVKPNDDGCSVMVSRVTDEKQLINTINEIFKHGKADVLVEECIGGMELTGGVVGNEKPTALPPSQAVSTADILSIEEKFLPGAGENQTPAPLPKRALVLVQKTLEEVYQALDCKGYARIDCFYQDAAQSPTGKERVVILEINTLPGLTPATCIFHQAAEIGLKPMEFIDLIVKLGLQEHQDLKFDFSSLITSYSKESIAS